MIAHGFRDSSLAFYKIDKTRVVTGNESWVSSVPVPLSRFVLFYLFFSRGIFSIQFTTGRSFRVNITISRFL